MRRAPSSVFREIGIHLAVWICYLVLQVVAMDRFEQQYAHHIGAALAEMPAQVLFTYAMLYWLIPRYLLTQRYVAFGTLTLIAVMISGTLYWQGYYYLFALPYDPTAVVNDGPWHLSHLVQCAFYQLCTSALLIGFHMIRYGFHQQQLNQQLIIANQRSELKSLKDQINPHFLFNTLNNLYGLTSQDPTKAGEVVMRLGQLMQYMLYEGSMPQVPLRKEIEYVQNYLALERIRYGDRLHVSFQRSGATDQLLVAPLLLLPFVENAFKHGASRQLDEAWVQIQLTVTSNELIFKVENSKPEVGDPVSTQGIGLPNIEKRLELIYPGRHQLRQLDGAGTYLATLRLELTARDFSPQKPHEDPVPAGR